LLHNLFLLAFGLAYRCENGYDLPIVTNYLKGVKRNIMERAKKALQLPDKQFKRVIGTTKSVFQRMTHVLQVAYDKAHEPGGKPPDLSVSDKLLMALQYYREYRTMEHIGIDYCCHKSTVSRTVKWVEETLSAHGDFQLPGKAALQDGDVKEVAIDVTEHTINRPKERQEEWYSGKKKAHKQVSNHCKHGLSLDLRCRPSTW
jgi:hypothetical protein